MNKKKKRSSFTGSIGFVLAAAGSAVGLGNIWRFPYLAAKNGGGIFLLTYLILVLTFGFTMLTTEVGIGRKTRQSPLTAYRFIHPKWGFIGLFACLVPSIILPYYAAIGGWVLKYLTAFVTMQGSAAAADGYFTGFITAQYAPIVFGLLFMLMTSACVYMGVDKGIEGISKILMPILLVLVIGIALFSLTLTHTDEDGTVRTGLQGLAVYVIPNFSGMTISKLFGVFIDALGQLFYSISVAMGIMVAYGSYVPKDAKMSSSINQIELFDTGVAFIAGMMIIPAVFTFMGSEGLAASGPSLMFVSLPKVFEAMGGVGTIVGIVFFLVVTFAALTSCISILEAVVSSFMDQFKMSRKKATILASILAAIISVIVCLGYNVLYFEVTLPNGSVAQILDIMDYISNNLFMPLVALFTCILIGWVVGPNYVIDEVEHGGHKMGRKTLYIVMVRFIAPILLTLLLLRSTGLLAVFGL
ncbi:MAG: sodium-dependent transporter [Oscillospiraceae bacterium]|nr:sodium-dependent transporter [Oscillospiraceae bacterium]